MIYTWKEHIHELAVGATFKITNIHYIATKTNLNSMFRFENGFGQFFLALWPRISRNYLPTYFGGPLKNLK